MSRMQDNVQVPGRLAPKFVIAHRERYVYGRTKRSKRLHMTERHFFYHCDLDCIQPRHPYFEMCDIETSPAVAANDDDIEYLLSLGVFL